MAGATTVQCDQVADEGDNRETLGDNRETLGDNRERLSSNRGSDEDLADNQTPIYW